MSHTAQLVIAILGVGVGLATLMVFLFRLLRQDSAEMRQDIRAFRQEVRSDISALNSRIDSLRQEMRTDIAALHSRIDALYQVLFSHKDPAA